MLGVKSRNGNGRGFWKALGLGWILGCFTNLLVFLKFAVNGLWMLSIFSVCVLVLYFLQVVKRDVEYQGVGGKSDDVDDGGRTLSSRLRIWGK